jgi:HAE1 family hydrophobic/amphiphilic exporter-1
MTSLVFILGGLPLARASGAGALSRQIMGFVVVGGILAASFIAIVLIPVLFYLLERFTGRKTEAAPGGPAKPALAPAVALVH